MAQQATVNFITEEEYFALEQKSQTKHEYFSGEVFAMAGGTYNHSLITTNLSAHLRELLKGRCDVTSPDLRTKVEATGLPAYPDATVVCGEPKLLSPADTLANPSLVAEILSPDSELYDRTFKFEHYKKIPALTTYLLLSQEAPHVEQYTRKGKIWEYASASGLEERLHLPALNITLALSELYRNVRFRRDSSSSIFPFHG